MAAAVRRVLRASRAWCAALRARAAPGAQTLRLIYTTTAVQKRNVAASGPEKYTEAFIKNQIEEFNLGKRHLANMMGEDPETFTQEDIDKAIAYLFPSGLFEKRARPIMKHPTEIFPKQRAIQWGEDHRPFHFLFYTGKQSLYSLMHEMYGKLLDIQKYQDHLRAQGLLAENRKQINLIGSRWLIKEELEEMLVEKLSDHDTRQTIICNILASYEIDSEELCIWHLTTCISKNKSINSLLQLVPGVRNNADVSITLRFSK